MWLVVFHRIQMTRMLYIFLENIVPWLTFRMKKKSKQVLFWLCSCLHDSNTFRTQSVTKWLRMLSLQAMTYTISFDKGSVYLQEHFHANRMWIGTNKTWVNQPSWLSWCLGSLVGADRQDNWCFLSEKMQPSAKPVYVDVTMFLLWNYLKCICIGRRPILIFTLLASMIFWYFLCTLNLYSCWLIIGHHEKQSRWN